MSSLLGTTPVPPPPPLLSVHTEGSAFPYTDKRKAKGEEREGVILPYLTDGGRGD
jgi:hypothetical protein